MIPKKVTQVIEDLVGRSPETIQNYTSFANVFWTHVKKDLEGLEVEDIMRFLKWGVDSQGWKLSTMGQYAKIMQRLMGELKDDEFMSKLKKKIRNLPRVGRYEHLYEGIYIPGDRIDEFIDAAKNEEYAVVYTMILKWGLRLGEVLSMDRQDIDAKRLRIAVRGKGRGMEKKLRPVWVDKESLASVMKFLGCDSTQISGAVPIGSKGKIVDVSQRSVEYAWKKTAKKIGLEHWEKLTPHDGRHSYAIDFLIKRKEQGMAALVLLKNQLGHSNVNTTMIYLDIAGTEAREVFDSGFK